MTSCRVARADTVKIEKRPIEGRVIRISDDSRNLRNGRVAVLEQPQRLFHPDGLQIAVHGRPKPPQKQLGKVFARIAEMFRHI